jgi:hypothetical protein
VRTTIKIISTLLVIIMILYFLLLSLGDVSQHVNTKARILLCENHLKIIAKAIILYQDDWNGQWPESFEAMKQYYEDPNYIPKCPGNRNDQETSDSWDYYFYKPRIKGIVPVCWDSKPHRFREAFLPDRLVWNVLYSDGHVESLEQNEFLKALEILAATNPDVLKVLNLLGEKNNGN